MTEETNVSSTTPEELEVIPPTRERLDREKCQEVFARCVRMGQGDTAVRILDGTTPDDYYLILGVFCHQRDYSMLQLGDVANQAPKVLGPKYEALMAATGLPYSYVKKAAWIARETPQEFRNLHPKIKPTHLAELAGLPKLEDKKAIVAELVEAAKKGNPLTAKEIRAKVVERTPKPRKKRPVRHEDTPYKMHGSEEMRLINLCTNLGDIIAAIKDKELAFLKLLPDSETKELRKHLGQLNAFYLQIQP